MVRSSTGAHLANALRQVSDGELDVVLGTVPLKLLRVGVERSFVGQQLFLNFGLLVLMEASG